MKRIIIVLFLQLICCQENYLFAQQDTITLSNLSVGISNQFFKFNEKEFCTVSPIIQFKLLNRLYILSQYQKYEDQDLQDFSNVRDGEPRMIYIENTYRQVPIALKYNIVEKNKSNYYIKFMVINQFQQRVKSIYKFNSEVQMSENNYYSMFYGIGTGFDFSFCDNRTIGMEAFYKTSKSFNFNTLGLEITYMFNIKLKNHEK